MSDYTKTTNFTAKDALSSGDPLKLIKGSDMDTEFDNIATAVATKFDTNDIASQVEVENETSNVTLVTPLRLAQWSDDNGGMVGDLQALADPGADRLYMWDESADAMVLAEVGTNLAISGTTLSAPTATLEASINHDNLTGFVAAEHLDWSSDQGATNIDVGNITEAAVTQHEAALSIAKSQLSDLATIDTSAAEAGTSTTDGLWSPERIAEAIAALESSGNDRGCKLHNSSTQSITTSTITTVGFNTEAYDSESLHDTVTNNSRITIPAGVTKIRLTGNVEWPQNGSAGRRLWFRKNGADGAIDDAVLTYQPYSWQEGSNAGAYAHTQYLDSGIITVAEGDYFEMRVWQNSGLSLSLPAYQTWFACEVIA